MTAPLEILHWEPVRLRRRPAMVRNLLLHVLLSFGANSNYWSKWSDWSTCSRTCDGGAAYQMRRCIESNRFQIGCRGSAIKYSTCNNDPCPSVDSFREEQCSAYNHRPYANKYYRWLPYYNQGDPCSLYCQAEGSTVVENLAPKVLDGTRCDRISFDMCINGQCWPVGCDRALNSKKEVDSCGLCDGNNTCSLNVTFNTKDIEYEWVVDGYTQCSVSCGVGYQYFQMACQDSVTKTRVNSSYCKGVMKQKMTRTQCYKRKCPPQYDAGFRFRWQVGEWHRCTRTCGGGISLRRVKCMERLLDRRRRWIHDRLCKQTKPSEYRSCKAEVCPRWYAGQWSPCSVTCGFGVQYREVICRYLGESYCKGANKPPVSQACTTNLPCFERTGDIQESILTDYKKSSFPKYGLPPNISKSNLSSPRFVVYAWSPCSATCGSGVETRRVTCKIFLQFLNEVTELPEQECLDKQQLRLSCYDATDKVVVKKDFCTEKPGLYLYHKWCSAETMGTFCFGWYLLEEYTACASGCGNSTQRRLVQCVEESYNGSNQGKFYAVQQKFCVEPMPERQKTCLSTEKCLASWSTGNWTKCSVSCGEGTKRRLLSCQKHISPDDIFIIVDESACAGIRRPVTIRVCNSFPCIQPKIKEPIQKFFQLRPMSKVNLFTGSEAYILPGTTVVIRCLVKASDKLGVQWIWNGVVLRLHSVQALYVRRNRRLKVFTRPNQQKMDVFTCTSGALLSNITLQYISLVSILQETALREQYLLRSSNVSFAMAVDPYDKRLRPLYYVLGTWSTCTAKTCTKTGRQFRNVTCEIITENYFEVLSNLICKKVGLGKKRKARKCRKSCFQWVTQSWSKCSLKKSAAKSCFIETRRVLCTNRASNATVRARHCRHTRRPPDCRIRYSFSCGLTPGTSNWSECIQNCAEKASQSKPRTHASWKTPGLAKLCSSFVSRPQHTHDHTDTLAQRCFKTCQFHVGGKRCCSTCIRRPATNKMIHLVILN